MSSAASLQEQRVTRWNDYAAGSLRRFLTPAGNSDMPSGSLESPEIVARRLPHLSGINANVDRVARNEWITWRAAVRSSPMRDHVIEAISARTPSRFDNFPNESETSGGQAAIIHLSPPSGERKFAVLPIPPIGTLFP